MCSVNDAEEVLNLSEKKHQQRANLDLCMKCGDKSVVLVRARDPMCRACFIHYFTHKFRSTLGKSKAIRQGEKVLIAFSGGASSCSLLQLINEGLSDSAHKKLRFIPEVVFINESLVLGWNDDKKGAIINDVEQFSQKLGFNIDVIDIEKIFIDQNIYSNDSKVEKSCCNVDEKVSDDGKSKSSVIDNAREKLKKSFLNVKSLTAKQDLLYSLRNRLLRDHAKEKQCSKIIVAETSTRLSIKLLLNIAQGRGGSLPYDVGVCDSRDDQLEVIRPMRELTSKEIALYNRMHSIESIVNESLDTLAASNASLQKQTEVFVTGLQASFPSTVSTIFRTGDKLTLSDDLASSDGHCVMCQTPASEKEAPTMDNSIPLKLKQPPEEGEEDRLGNPSCCGKGDGSCQNRASYNTNSVIQSSDIHRKLCYGCRLTFKDMGGTLDSLPPYVISEYQKSSRRSQLKHSIQDYLLDCPP